jgi:F-type H+-transporting ATPase subunit b
MTATLIAAGGGNFTDVNVATVLWTWAVFVVTYFALKKVAWPMLQSKMEEREVRISEGLKKAEEAEARAKELMERQEEILEEARGEAQKLLAESRSAAENIKNETLAAAQTEIQTERERAKKEIDLERSRAVDELKRAVVDLTLDAAGRVLERELKDEDHRRLASEAIGRVESLK